MPDLAGGGPNPSDNPDRTSPVSQVPLGLREIQSRLVRYIDDAVKSALESTGSSTAYVLTPSGMDAGYPSMIPAAGYYRFVPHVESGDSPTIDVGGFGPLPLLWTDGEPVEQGQLTRGDVVSIAPKSDYTAWIVIEPQPPDDIGLVSITAQIQDAIAAGQPITRADGSADERVAKSDLGPLNMPPGSILWWSSTVAPMGYLACEGQAVDRITYSRLFGALGETWGAGDGSTTFNVPDMRGRCGLGISGTRSVSQQGGTETHSLGKGEIAAHAHTVTVTVSSAGAHSHSATVASDGSHSHGGTYTAGEAGGHTHTVAIPANQYGEGNTQSQDSDYYGSGIHENVTESAGSHTHTSTISLDSAGNHSHTVTINSGGGHSHSASLSTENTGDGDGHANMMPFIALLPIIRY